MNTRTLLSKCRQIPGRIFGNISWNPPRWFGRIAEVWRSLERQHPRAIAPGIILIFLFCCAAGWSWNWYKSRPKPHMVTARILDVSVTKLEKDLKFPELFVTFSEPAARLEDLDKTALSGVRLEPYVAGSWHWTNDHLLTFHPTEDWPADKKLRVVFDKKLFPRQVLMERLVYETKTPAFGIEVKNFQLYQDPTNPTQRQVTATLELTHSIEPGELDRHIQLAMIGDSKVFPPNETAPHFNLSYGLHHRLVYLRTSTIALPEKEDFMKLGVSKGVRTSQGGAQTQNLVEQKLKIPSAETMFHIDSIDGTVTCNKAGEPEQVIVLATTADIATNELAKSLEIRLLPKRKIPEETDADSNSENVEEHSPDREEEFGENEEDAGDSLKPGEKWKSATDVPDDIIEAAKPVEFTALPSDKAQDRQHAFRVRVESDGEIHVRVRKGVRALGDFKLVEDYNAVVDVPRLPREVQIEGRGGLLALNGEKKLSVRSRGLDIIQYEIARVATTQINHLVSQTEGKFQHPEFAASYAFNEENISRIGIEQQPIALENNWKANYSAFDFSDKLRKPADGGSERGLFFLTAQGWDSKKKKPIRSIKDSRFLLVTDIGILTKHNADGSHDVFTMSIKQGKPLGNVSVDLLGKNGIPLQTATTDAEGHCAFASVERSTREKSPVAFVARNGDDVSFIPYAREDRRINFSRFDIDGVDNVLPENLDAFVFTERGVYRPGDEVHIGIVVKQRNWQGHLNGLPVETEVVDARGLRVQTKKMTLPESGFMELSYQTANESPTGLYNFSVYVTKDSKRSTLLGSTTANVKEFLPDRMKIDAQLSANAKRGWINPEDVHAAISLANLYGTPATDRRVTARIELAPASFGFHEFPGFVFFDPLVEEKKDRQAQTVDLGEKKTDTDGKTEFDLQLERFADATYSMQFIADGFEGEGGRSVTVVQQALVSALPYVIGCKADGDLRYIDMQESRTLELIALDPQLNRIAVENVTLNVIAQEYVSVLAKQESGKYAYESVLKERVANTQKISVPANGFRFPLRVVEPGNYVFELRDDQGHRLTKLQFCVAGRGTVARSLEKNSELEIKLDRQQYNSGDEIAVSITAPYAGSGLITIERDHVYTQQWFQASSTGSVQHIRVPDNFEGSGYINVAFVRALDSTEIFVSPLSYGVAHFTANLERRRLNIDLTVAAKSKPGQPLRISYKTDRPGKIVLFAVDEGILQVTNYKTPDPLEFYFRKCALRVDTAQIVDLIIPEFSLLRSASAFGGGGDIQRLNPFKRVTDKPVVFWSGILDADTATRSVVYDVPDFFDGNLKIMAIAVSNETTGSAERDSVIRGPFVITPSVPVLAAPGDEFEAGVTVANNIEGSGPNVEIEVRAETNEQLSIKGAGSQRLRIAENREQSLVFRFHVTDKLGSGEIRFVARHDGDETQRHATLSVRPPVPYMTSVRGGSFTKVSNEIPISRELRPEFRKLEAVVSALPLGLAHGLDSYLREFPHGCSEQITSGAFCRLMLADEADFGLSRAEISKQLEYTFGILRRRQNDQGAFGYWVPETGDNISFVSAYVMDFLSEAKSAGFAPPPEMFASGMRNLQKMVGREPRDLNDARTIAYAIYILTHEGVITTNYILNLRDFLDKKKPNEWQNDITSVYLAGALHLLHKDAEAERVIGYYKIDNHSRACGDFYSYLGTDAQYVAMLAREFPARLKNFTAAQFDNLLGPIGNGMFNTLSAAYSVRALKAYSHAVAQNPPDLSITEIRSGKHAVRLTSGAMLLQRAPFSGETKSLRFESAMRLNGAGAFFQVIERGFDLHVPTQSLVEGLEVYREVLGRDNKPVTRTQLGEPLRVRLHARSVRYGSITNVAIIDLLPGGFEIVDPALHAGAGRIGGVDYADFREDRAIFYATVPSNAVEIDYQIKSCNRGDFVVPPVFAESMYDRTIKGRGEGGKISVTQ